MAQLAGWLPRLTHDSTHLLIGWRKDGWKGPHLQWEFGAYVNLDLAISERHDYRWTYNYPEWRIHGAHFQPSLDPAPLPRFKFTRS
jgi:hypothetical protein